MNQVKYRSDWTVNITQTIGDTLELCCICVTIAYVIWQQVDNKSSQKGGRTNFSARIVLQLTLIFLQSVFWNVKDYWLVIN